MAASAGVKVDNPDEIFFNLKIHSYTSTCPPTPTTP